MQHQPFEHMRLSAAREAAVHFSIANTHTDSIVTIRCMEVRGVVRKICDRRKFASASGARYR